MSQMLGNEMAHSYVRKYEILDERDRIFFLMEHKNRSLFPKIVVRIFLRKI